MNRLRRGTPEAGRPRGFLYVIVEFVASLGSGGVDNGDVRVGLGEGSDAGRAHTCAASGDEGVLAGEVTGEFGHVLSRQCVGVDNEAIVHVGGRDNAVFC